MPIYKANGKKDGLQKYNVRINYMDSTGKARQLTRIAYGLTEAKDLERRLSADQAIRHNVTSTRVMNIQQLYDEYIAAKQYKVRVSSLEKSIYTMERHILPLLRDIRLDSLTAKVLEDWKQSIEQLVTVRGGGLSLRTKQHAYDNLNAMLNYALKMDYLPKNPLRAVGNFTDSTAIRKEMQYYTAQEFQQFISAARQHAQSKEIADKDLSEWDYFVFFNIAFYTGLRKGEIHALKWSDLRGAYLSVRRSVKQIRIGHDRETPPKNKTSIRTLQMPIPLIRILESHKMRQGQSKSFNDDYRICGGERHLRDSSIDKRNVLYSEKAGVKRIRLHDFRHSHVSVLANEGVNIQEIARRLGHSKIEMTWNTYSHLYPREEERAVEILNLIV